jgi:hypothetical protein
VHRREMLDFPLLALDLTALAIAQDGPDTLAHPGLCRGVVVIDLDGGCHGLGRDLGNEQPQQRRDLGERGSMIDGFRACQAALQLGAAASRYSVSRAPKVSLAASAAPALMAWARASASIAAIGPSRPSVAFAWPDEVPALRRY